MKPFDVYPLVDITPIRAEGYKLWDELGNEYIDLYGGHAVISIGHNHPHYLMRIKEQLEKISFYSNSVQIPVQKEVAALLGQLSGYEDYDLFLCSSGAEANENALKLASFETGKAGIISFKGAFHGRTSGAVSLTDNPKIIAPFNASHAAHILPMDLQVVEDTLKTGEIAGIIIEGIQGVAGIQVPDESFLLGLQSLCKQYGAKLILDEVQSGYGRTGKFFAHQWAEGLQPDLITVAKGMGNGFPIGGVLIHPDIPAKHGMLGTTFGGNHLACVAALAVLEVMQSENLSENALEIGKKLKSRLESLDGITDVRGRGLMIGFDVEKEAAPVRSALIHDYRIFTGNAANKHTIRILPPLNISAAAIDYFLDSLEKALALNKVS